MSLEQELARNTAAMTALTAALRDYLDAPVTIAEIDRLVAPGIPVVHTSAPVVTGAEWAALQEKEVPKSELASSARAAMRASLVVAATPAPSTTSDMTAASGTPTATLTIEYAQVAKAITDVFKVDRAKVVAALALFGAAKGPQLKAEDYAAFLVELGA